MRTHEAKTLKRARQLRQEMSLPEVLLWMQLKARPGGHKFRKQHPFGLFVADFYCDAAKLVIEVDGEAHNCGDQPQYDLERDAWFASQAVATLRIPARDVLADMDSVVRYIVAVVDAAVAPPALRATSPGGGGLSLEY